MDESAKATAKRASRIDLAPADQKTVSRGDGPRGQRRGGGPLSGAEQLRATGRKHRMQLSGLDKLPSREAKLGQNPGGGALERRPQGHPGTITEDELLQQRASPSAGEASPSAGTETMFGPTHFQPSLSARATA